MPEGPHLSSEVLGQGGHWWVGPNLSRATIKRPKPGSCVSSEGPQPDHSVISPRPFRGPLRTRNASAPIRPIPWFPSAPPPGRPCWPFAAFPRPSTPATAGAHFVHAPPPPGLPRRLDVERQAKVGPEIRVDLSELARADLGGPGPRAFASFIDARVPEADARQLWDLPTPGIDPREMAYLATCGPVPSKSPGSEMDASRGPDY